MNDLFFSRIAKLLVFTLVASGSSMSLANEETSFVASDNIWAKVFALQGYCGPSATWTYDRTQGDGAVIIKRTHSQFDENSAYCRVFVNSFVLTPTHYWWLRKDNFVLSGGPVLEASFVWDRPIPKLVATMADHNMIGHAATSTVTPGHTVETSTLLGVEDVTVPYGNYKACLKIHTSRVGDDTGHVSQISWRCLGVGIVKIIRGHTTSGNMQVHELSGIIYQ